MNSNIPVIILAGGLGTRISEETFDKPKPMVTIGQHPILWHIMNIYSIQGFNNFIIATGFKSEVIDEWIRKSYEYKLFNPEWKVKTEFTEINTQTGGRLAQVIDRNPFDTYFMTYGDGLANVNLKKLLKFHRAHKKIATVTAVRPPARFGVIESKEGLVTHFGEKNQTEAGWINGGFFVLESAIKKYLIDINEPFEKLPMQQLVENQELMALNHHGFWQPMDTLREKLILEDLAKKEVPIWTKFS